MIFFPDLKFQEPLVVLDNFHPEIEIHEQHLLITPASDYFFSFFTFRCNNDIQGRRWLQRRIELNRLKNVLRYTYKQNLILFFLFN